MTFVPALTSTILSAIPGLRHAFGTRAEPVPAAFAAEWARARPSWRQVHGTRAVQVLGPRQECGEADAFYTSAMDQPIAVVSADCVPVLMADLGGSWVAAAHAGWRGTRARVLGALWKDLSAVVAATEGRAPNPARWVAAIGPAAGPCCYEVSEELADDFSREFAAAYGHDVVVPRRRHLDLPSINQAQLLEIGFGQVEVLRFCTLCARAAPDSGASSSDFLFHSFRREGTRDRQWSIISRPNLDAPPKI